MEEFYTLWNKVLVHLSDTIIISFGDVVLVALLIFGGYLLGKILNVIIARHLASTSLRSDAVAIIKRISFYVIFCLIGLTVLGILGIPITVFAFATGAIAIGVGFGAQNIINNFISGWILMAEQPIRQSDFIEIEGAYGSVEKIGTRSTRIRRSDGVYMLVPNSKLLENTVVNWTLLDQVIRSNIRVGVEYGSDTNVVSTLLEKVVCGHSSVLSEPVPEFIFEDFGDNALIFDCFFGAILQVKNR